jgi:hypothetical protein
MKKGESVYLRMGEQTVHLKVIAVYKRPSKQERAALRCQARMSMDEEMLEANR